MNLPDPSCITPPLQNASSGKPYLIGNYVTCDKFSDADTLYLYPITKFMKPRFYHEAVKDAN